MPWNLYKYLLHQVRGSCDHHVTWANIATVPTPSNQQQQAQEQSEDRLTLRDVVTTDALRPLIRENTDDVNSDLIQHLPPTGESVETALSTPQFQQVN